jgi:hypothetical protein
MNSFQPQDDRIGALGDAMNTGQGLLRLQQQQRLMQAAQSGQLGQALGMGGGATGGPGNAAGAILPYLTGDELQKVIETQATSGIAAQTKLQEDKNQGWYEANAALPKLTQNMTDMDNRINTIKNTPEGDSTALANIMSDDNKKRAVAGMLSVDDNKEGWFGTYLEQHQQQWANLTPAEQGVAMQMKQLGGQQYGQAFSSLGGASRRSTQEVAGINAGLSQVKDLTQPLVSPDGKSGYLPALNQLQNQVHIGLANAYGAAGKLDAMPDNLKWGPDGKPLVDQTFRPGGTFYINGGDWLNHPPAQGAQPAQGGGPPPTAINTPGDFSATYNKLPSGATYTAPDGTTRRKG